MVKIFTVLTSFSSKRSHVLENLAAGSVSLTKEELDQVIKLIEGPNVHGQ